MTRLGAAALTAFTLTACGSAVIATPTPSCTPAPPPPAPQASAPPVAAAADRARVDPGGTVTFTEAVRGPAKINIDCQLPLQLIVSDSTQLHVYSGQSAAAQAGHCGGLTLPARGTETYSVTWPVDVTLPGGAYTITLLLGDAPQLTLTVAVGTVPGGC